MRGVDLFNIRGRWLACSSQVSVNLGQSRPKDLRQLSKLKSVIDTVLESPNLGLKSGEKLSCSVTWFQPPVRVKRGEVQDLGFGDQSAIQLYYRNLGLRVVYLWISVASQRSRPCRSEEQPEKQCRPRPHLTNSVGS